MSKSGRKRHSPEQIVKKLRDADAMLSAGQDLAAVLQAMEVSEQISIAGRTSTAAVVGGIEAAGFCAGSDDQSRLSIWLKFLDFGDKTDNAMFRRRRLVGDALNPTGGLIEIAVRWSEAGIQIENCIVQAVATVADNQHTRGGRLVVRVGSYDDCRAGTGRYRLGCSELVRELFFDRTKRHVADTIHFSQFPITTFHIRLEHRQVTERRDIQADPHTVTVKTS